MAFWRTVQLDLPDDLKHGHTNKWPSRKRLTGSSHLEVIAEGPDIKEAPALQELSDKIDHELKTLDANRQNTAEQIQKLFMKCHETISRLEEELLRDLDDTCKYKENNLKSQRASVQHTLEDLRSLEVQSASSNPISHPEKYDELDISVQEGSINLNISNTLEKLRSLEVESALSNPIPHPERYDELEISVKARSIDLKTSVEKMSSLTQSICGHNLQAREVPKSGSNCMQPIECSFVDITYNQSALLHRLDSFFEEHVKLYASEVSPAKTQVFVGMALVDHITNITVKTFYPEGEECVNGGEPICAELSCSNGTKVSGPVKDNDDGTYVVSFLPTSPGTHILSLTVQNTPISHSPYEIYVSPVCPSKSTATASPCMVDYAGLTSVTARDSAGNQCFYGGDQVVADFRDPHGEPLRCSIDDSGNGTYHVTYNPVIAGIHSLRITIHGENIKDNPLEIPVRAISAKQTKIKIKRPRLGKLSRTMVHAIDYKGQRLRHGGDLITAHLYNEMDEQQQCTVRDNHNGTYTIMYTPTKPGEYLLGISIHQWCMNSEKPFIVNVQPKQPGLCEDFLDKWNDFTNWIENQVNKDSHVEISGSLSNSQAADSELQGDKVQPPSCAIF